MTCEECGNPCRKYRNRPGRWCSPKCAGIAKREPLSDRFWAKVDKSGGPGACWRWTATIRSDGYGMIDVGGKMTGAHRDDMGRFATVVQ